MKRRTFIFGGLAAGAALAGYGFCRNEQPPTFEEAVHDESLRQGYLDTLVEEYPIFYDPQLEHFKEQKRAQGMASVTIVPGTGKPDQITIKTRPYEENEQDKLAFSSALMVTGLTLYDFGVGKKSTIHVSARAFKELHTGKPEISDKIFRAGIRHELQHCKDYLSGFHAGPGLPVSKATVWYFFTLGIDQDMIELRGYGAHLHAERELIGGWTEHPAYQYVQHLNRIEHFLKTNKTPKLGAVHINRTLQAIVDAQYSDITLREVIAKTR